MTVVNAFIRILIKIIHIKKSTIKKTNIASILFNKNVT